MDDWMKYSASAAKSFVLFDFPGALGGGVCIEIVIGAVSQDDVSSRCLSPACRLVSPCAGGLVWPGGVRVGPLRPRLHVLRR